MPGFVIRKIVYLTVVVFAVTALTFLLAALLPGDLAMSLLGDQATPENVAVLRSRLGLDLPLWRRYLEWLAHALTGDLGFSPRTGETAMHAILSRLPVSLELAVLAQLGALAIGVPLGILSAARHGSRFDRIASGVAFGVLSVPPYLLAIVLIFVFSVRLGILPSAGFVPLSDGLGAHLLSLLLPALTLALVSWPAPMRVLRADMIATLGENYIALARAKGLRTRRILLVHALKPSSLALVTVTGFNFGQLISIAVVVETIFALPGLGRLLVDSLYTRDFMVLQATVVFITVAFVLVNFVVDLLYAVLDPRIRHGRA
ncbi:MAG: ABC transporter permease [Sulfurifustaceae bacterium]